MLGMGVHGKSCFLHCRYKKSFLHIIDGKLKEYLDVTLDFFLHCFAAL